MTSCKEYLDANCNYEFVRSNKKYDGFIEIPEGAEVAIYDDGKISFAKPMNDGDDVLVLDVGRDLDWDTTEWDSWSGFVNYGFDIIWQRTTHPEELPFIDDEPKSINDQYAEIEQVRQHNHYFKDVSGINEIDVYMVLKLFNVTDPCLQHIAKKALCAGRRGHKDFKKDLQDILDTAKRAVEINNG